MIEHSPACWTCQDKGYLRKPGTGGIDACPACAAAAELTFRIAQESSEQQRAARPVRRALRVIGSEAA